MTMHCTPIVLLFADSTHLCRVNYDSLSQQNLMEIVVQEGADKQNFQDLNGDYKNVCQWDGITCNEKQEVISIGSEENYFMPSGKLDFNFLPTSVEKVHISADSEFPIDVDLAKLPLKLVIFVVSCCTAQQINVSGLSCHLEEFYVSDSLLTGTLSTADLPPGLRELGLSLNNLSGTVSLEQLPCNLESLQLDSNKLTGTLDMSRLPKTLLEMYLGENQFHGSIDLSNLPGGMETVDIEHNQLTGAISLSYLPETISTISLGENSFEGNIRLPDLPIATSVVTFNENRLSGEVSLRGLSHNLLIDLCLDDNQFRGSVDFTELPQGLLRLRINKNKFTGTVDLSLLPATLRELNLSDNLLTGSVDINVMPERLTLLDIGGNNFLHDWRIGELLILNGESEDRDENK